MKLGVPREIKNGETRVSLVPQQVEELVELGVDVVVQSGAGSGSFFSDREYQAAGAMLVEKSADVWNAVDTVLKVKEPLAEEYKFFRKSLTVFSFLHPAAFPEMTRQLVQSGTTAYSYDLLFDADGKLPILHPMSVIAGTISLYAGSNSLFSSTGARGVLLSPVCGISAGEVLILGAGSAGTAAAKTAIGFGAKTYVLDINSDALARIKTRLPEVIVAENTSEILSQRLESADLLVSAVLVAGDKAPKLLDRELISKMKSGAVFVDIAIDQGGTSSTSRPTSIDQPTYEENGVIHYCVPNMPALASKTSTLALTNQSFPYVKALLGLDSSEGKTVQIQASLKTALLCKNNQLLNETVKSALGTI